MKILFSWIHLSDLHVGHGDDRTRWDQRLVLEELRLDISRRQGLPASDAILVTGDIAFSGATRSLPPVFDEYQEAARWLRQAAQAAGLTAERVFVVPGNHDVQRSVEQGDKDVARLLRVLRDDEEPMDTALRESSEDLSRLRRRMRNYLSFCRSFAPACVQPATQPPGDPWDQIFWKSPLPPQEGLKIRLIGLNTAILSADDHDRGHLKLGTRQLSETLIPAPEPDELLMVLSHHPFTGGWLADEEEAQGWLQRHARLHLHGHIHRQGSQRIRSGGQDGLVRLIAGAVHGEQLAPGVPEEYGYCYGAIFAERDGRLGVRVWPRRFSQKNKRFVVDTDNVDGDRPYAEHELTMRLPAAPRSGRQRTGSAPAKNGHPAALADRIHAALQGAHGQEIANAVNALAGGEYVAFEVPAGFGAQRCLHRVLDECGKQPDTIVHHFPARILAGDRDAYLDESYDALANKIPMPGRYQDKKRDYRLYRELREAIMTLHGKAQRLIVSVDEIDRFRPEHQGWVGDLLGVFAHIADYKGSDPALGAFSVVVAGGEMLQRHLLGTVKANPLSPFKEAQRIFLGPIVLSATEISADPELAQIIHEVGGHPELLRWAAARDGATDGQPAAQPGFFHEQRERFRQPPYRQQLERMLALDAATWRDPDLAIRWSGWIKTKTPEQGWLGPVLERVARDCVA